MEDKRNAKYIAEAVQAFSFFSFLAVAIVSISSCYVESEKQNKERIIELKRLDIQHEIDKSQK